jgi:hypothetical protein
MTYLRFSHSVESHLRSYHVHGTLIKMSISTNKFSAELASWGTRLTNLDEATHGERRTPSVPLKRTFWANTAIPKKLTSYRLSMQCWRFWTTLPSHTRPFNSRTSCNFPALIARPPSPTGHNARWTPSPTASLAFVSSQLQPIRTRRRRR